MNYEYLAFGFESFCFPVFEVSTDTTGVSMFVSFADIVKTEK